MSNSLTMASNREQLPILPDPEPMQHLSQLPIRCFLVFKVSVYTESIKPTLKAVLPTGA
jgi:hypothetical protein